MSKHSIGKSALKVEYLVGAVVFARYKENIYLALVHDIFGHWTLAKGRVERNETKNDALHREMREELGLPVHIMQKLGTNSYLMHHPKKGRIKKVVDYYLAKAPYQKLVLESGAGGLDDVRWVKREALEKMKLYEDIRHILQSAISLIH